MKTYTRVLSIAGSDSGGGAGIQADIKTISSLGCYAMTAITSVTSQNTIGVQRIDPLPAESVVAQIKSVLDDIGADAIKIGMLGNTEVIREVSLALRNYPSIPIVFDPVMVATSGDTLVEEKSTQTMIEYLTPLATLITPNIFEAKILSGNDVKSVEDMKIACEKIATFGSKSILIKGGDLDSEKAVDILFQSKGKSFKQFESRMIQTKNTHGTGCSLSSAIACSLAKKQSMPQSIQQAKDYISKAIESGSSFKIGQGRGPINHFCFSK